MDKTVAVERMNYMEGRRDRWKALLGPLPTPLQTQWQTARVLMGIGRALMLLEDTLAEARREHK